MDTSETLNSSQLLATENLDQDFRKNDENLEKVVIPGNNRLFLPLIKETTEEGMKINDASKDMYIRRANSIRAIQKWMLMERRSFPGNEIYTRDEKNQTYKKENNTNDIFKNVSQSNEEIYKDSPRLQNNSFQCKAVIHPVSRSLSDDEKIKDSMIIRDLVMKDYRKFLNSYKDRSLQRKQTRKLKGALKERQKSEEVTSNLDAKIFVEENKSTDKPTSLYRKIVDNDENQTGDLHRPPNSGLDATQESYYSCTFTDSFKTCEESLKVDQIKFLEEALGAEYMNVTSDSQQICENGCSTPISLQRIQPISQAGVKTNEISTRALPIDAIDSLYSTVDKSKKTKRLSVQNTSVQHFLERNSPDPYIYESMEHLQVSSRSDKLSTDISIQDVIIAQASKAVNFCRRSPEFYKSIPYLEAEKCLLYATYKKKILEDELGGQYVNIEPQQCFGTVELQNLIFYLSPRGMAQNNHTERCYMCLIYSDEILFATDTVVPEKSGNIVFRKSFHFNKLSSDFQIHIRLFSMTLEDKKENLCCCPIKIFSWRNRRLQHDVAQTTSSFDLIGGSALTISNIYNDFFTLKTPTWEYSVSQDFIVDVNSHVKINSKCSGYLTIGTSNIAWNRRWCTLEGAILKYWNYPNEESVKEPIGTFNLTDCIIHQVVTVDKVLCSRRKIFMLSFFSESTDEKQYFFQADNLIEFVQWMEQLEFVFKSLTNWKCFK